MKRLVFSLLLLSGLSMGGSSRADDVVVLKPTVVVGRAQKPHVTIEVVRQRPAIPLQALKSPAAVRAELSASKAPL